MRKKELEKLVEQYDDTLGSYRETLGFMIERIDELELARDDFGWLSMNTEDEFDFSKDGLNKIVRDCRLMAIKNPIINRGVEVDVFYVWGQGFAFHAKDNKVQEQLEEFWDNEVNEAELTSKQALEMKERKIMTEGNIFFVFFRNAAGEVTIRTIPFNQITKVYSEDGDIKIPILYHRKWQKRVLNASTGEEDIVEAEKFYPHWEFSDKAPKSVNGVKVEDAVVYHVKVGGFDDMTYGIPEIYPAIDWALGYKNFLEDWSTIVRAHRSFAFQVLSQTPAGVEEAKLKLNTTVAVGQGENNPSPGVGSFFLGTPGSKIEPVKTGGATVTAEDGRRLMLMAAAGLGFPETFFGDVSTGNLATAQTLDRPTELKITSRRDLWKSILGNIFDYVIDSKIKVGKLKKNVNTTVDITFPNVLEHDVDSTIDSLVNAATLNGFQQAGVMPPQILSTLILTALGVDNVTEIVNMMYDADGISKFAPAPPETSDKTPNQATAEAPTGSKKDQSIPEKDPPTDKNMMNNKAKEALKEIMSVFEKRGRVIE